MTSETSRETSGDSKIPWQTFLASWKTKCGEENSLVSDSLWQLFWVHGKVHSLAAMNSSTSMSIPRIDQRKYLQVNLLIHFHRKKCIYIYIYIYCFLFFSWGLPEKRYLLIAAVNPWPWVCPKMGPRSYGRLKGDMMIMKSCFSKNVSGTKPMCVYNYI